MCSMREIVKNVSDVGDVGQRFGSGVLKQCCMMGDR